MRFLSVFGRYVIFMSRVFSRPEKARIYLKQTILEMESLGFNSVGIVIIISIFSGCNYPANPVQP